MKPKALKKVNFRSANDKPLNIDASTVPTLIPEAAQKEWMAGDSEPYYKIQKIDYPIKANGYNYVESFFESFVDKLNKAPIPGSKAGHEIQWGKRGPTDIILVGGMLEKKGNGGGSVYLKNYIPKSGDSGSNETLIKESKSNMIEFSLVSYTKDEVIENPDGMLINVVESLYGERNDVVEYGTGAMEQKTNSENPGNAGENKGDSMNPKEILGEVSVHVNNGKLDLNTIAEHLNLSEKLVKPEHTKAIDVLGKINKLVGDNDPVQFVESLITEKKENTAAVRAAKMSELFGKKSDGEKVNVIRDYAEQYLDGKEITEDAVKSLKENSVFKQLTAQDADYMSKQNSIGIADDQEDDKQNKDSDTIVCDY